MSSNRSFPKQIRAVNFILQCSQGRQCIHSIFIPHDVLYACPLAEECINDRSPWWDKGGLAEEGKKCQYAVEGLEFLLPLWLDCHTLTEFRQDYQVQDNWAG